MIDAITKLLERQDTTEVIEISCILAEIEGGIRPGCIAPLTQQEYVTLMADVERLKQIIALRNNLELNELIHDAVLGLIEVAKLVKF